MTVGPLQPEPLGRGWTPPGAAPDPTGPVAWGDADEPGVPSFEEAAGSGDGDSGGGLASLFSTGTDPAATPGARDPEDHASVDRPSGRSDDAPAAGLAHLFGDSDAGWSTPTQQAQDASTETQSWGSPPDTAPRAVVETLAEDTPDTDTTTGAKATVKPRIRRRAVPQAVAVVRSPLADEEQDNDDAGPATGIDGDHADPIGALVLPEVPKITVTQRPIHDAAREPARQQERRPDVWGGPRNDQETERIWGLVDQTLAVISADPGLQRITATLDLTQDQNQYREQRDLLENALRPRMAAASIPISGPDDIDKIVARVHDELIGISVLGDLWRDPEVDEIMVDRWDRIAVERHGELVGTSVRFRNAQHAESTARVLALKISDRAVSRSIPLVTAELPSARVTFAFGSVVKGGLSVTIRKFKKLLGLDELLAYGSLSEEMVAFLRDAVRARASILVSGGTGTGKTTIVNLLSTFIPDSERVITIEDAFELKLANTHVVSLQTKEASSLDDTVSVTLAHLLRNTLRMRPDRIIVGEIREGEGALVMLAAASTGHDGTITTIHANSPESALNDRLPDLVRQERAGRDDGAILRSVAGAFDLVIQVTRGRSGRRYISAVSAVLDVDAKGGRILTDPVFVGIEHGDGVEYTRWPLRGDTELAQRMQQQGGGTWTAS